MKKILIIAIIICLFAFNTSSQTKSNMSENDNFEITVTSHYFGRKDKIITVNYDKIIFEKNIAINMQNHSKGDLIISEDFKQEIHNFFIKNPIESFKDLYFNKNVKDGTVLSFTLKVDDNKKEIFVSNYYIEELGELVKIINKTIPKEYLIQYTQDCCKSISK